MWGRRTETETQFVGTETGTETETQLVLPSPLTGGTPGRPKGHAQQFGSARGGRDRSVAGFRVRIMVCDAA